MASDTPLSGYCLAAAGHPYHGPYHDREYGFPLRDDDLLFERLILEINQAGLAWLTILKKREGFTRAYQGFDVERVAGYGADDRVRLFKKTFRFTGGEITGEFLISTGYLPGAHAPECPIFEAVVKLDPPWMGTA